MFLSKPGEYEPCGMFTLKHLLLFIITWLLILVAVKNTKIMQKEDIKKIIRKFTIVIWILEIIKIIYNFAIGKGAEINKVIPLYYCSLLLYSGILSSYGKGTLKRMGDVFIATGGIIGGIVFLIFPTTSLPEYPFFHFISLHSFFFHGAMVYLGIIVNKFKYVELKFSDIKYYALLIAIVCLGAFIINEKFGSNLMFISKDFPGTPLSTLYNGTGKLYTPLSCLVQMTLPFLLVYFIVKTKDYICKKIQTKIEQ